MKKIYILALLSVLLCGLTASAQDGSNKGRDFWVAFPPNHSIQNLTVIISSEHAVKGTIKNSLLGIDEAFSIDAGAVREINISTTGQLQEALEDKGIHIQATDRVAVYGLSYHQYTTDALMALPTDVLGKYYILQNYQGTIYGGVTVIASEDNTQVQLVNSALGLNSSYTLNKGQTLYKTMGRDGSGTLITGDKPIAVIASNQCANVPNLCGACDVLLEQLFPVSSWGRSFVSIPTAGRSKTRDIYRIMASEDNTEVKIDGNLVVTLNKGHYHEIDLAQGVTIETNKPSMVTLFAVGIGCSGGEVGDPFMMIVPPCEQYLKSYIVSSVGGFKSDYINLITPTAAVNEVVMDGENVNGALFTSIGTSGYSGVQIAVADGTHIINSEAPVGVFCYGWNSSNSYGYSGGTSLSEIGLVRKVTLEAGNSAGIVETPVVLTALVTDDEDIPVKNILVEFRVTGTNAKVGTAYTNETGVAQYNFNAAKPGNDQVIAVATGYSSSSVDIVWEDKTGPAPDMETLPVVNGECSVTVTAVPTATDFCWGPVSGTTTDALEFTKQGTYTITWNYDDGHGNVSHQTQQVMVKDVTAPVADVAELPVVTGECSVTVTVSPTATDNCVGSVTGTTTDVLEYTEQGTHTITWNYDDGHGNVSHQTQQVIVDDVTAPVADVAELPVVSGDCSVTVSVPPTATDNCVGSVKGTTSDALEYPAQGTYTITWNYDDGHGNVSHQTQQVIVDDVTAPVADVAELPVVSGDCSVTVSVPPTATDNCVGSVMGTTTDLLEYTEQGSYTIRWNYDDGHSNVSHQTQQVIVDDVTAPVADVAELPAITGECSATVSDVPTATDACFGSVTGTTTDPLTYTEQGTYIITWNYDDGHSNVSHQTQQVLVDDVTAPVADVAELPAITGECSATVSDVPTATDACFGSVTGTTTDPLTYTEQGTYIITWNYDDGLGNVSHQTQQVLVDDVTVPIADMAELPEVSGECSATVAVRPTATDNCVGSVTGTTTDPLTYTEQGTYTITWNYDDGHGNVSYQTQQVVVDDVTSPVAVLIELPVVTGECSVRIIDQPTAIDNCVGTVTGNTTDDLEYTEQGAYSIMWSYDDGHGNVSYQTQQVIVRDIIAPIADVPELSAVTGDCSVTVTGQPTATDNCVGSVIGTTTDALEYTEQGSYTITWNYDDGYGNVSYQTQQVIVDDDTAPIADEPSLPVVTGECGVTVSETPTATDFCWGATLGTTTDALEYNEQGTYSITWNYDDGYGNVSHQTQQVIVKDITAPIADVIELPAVTGECSAIVSDVPTATDACLGSVTGTTTDPLTYTEQGTYGITWNYNDGQGNISHQEQQVIVEDVTAPIADAAELPTVMGECAATVTGHPTATDACAGSVEGTTTDPLSYIEQGSFAITWNYDDGYGNVSYQTQHVIVDDVTAPVADVAELPSVTGECSVTVEVPTATDNCVGTISGTTTAPLTYTEQGTYTITWTYDDGHDNILHQTQQVIVKDVTAPVADLADLPVLTGECSVMVSEIPLATDNCVGSIMGTTTDDLKYTKQGAYTITWNYDDGHGNVTHQTQQVMVDDVTAPVADIDDLPVLTGECSVMVTEIPLATDNCVGSIMGTTTDDLEYIEQGSYTITWNYDDGHGNVTHQAQQVVVADVIAPVPAVAELPELKGECSVIVTEIPVAIDNCVGSVMGTTTDDLEYTEQGSYTITWTYDDGQGNVSHQTQQVIVADVIAPVADVAVLPVIKGECSVTVTEIPVAIDNCVGSVTGTTTDPLTFTEQGTHVIKWTYHDGHGNVSYQTQQVIVDDVTAPVADVAELPVVTGECTVIAVAPTATDNCVGSVTGTTTDPLEYTEQGTYIITWNYNDAQGNVSHQTQLVTVGDDTAPIADVTELPVQTGECGVTVSEIPVATDNCVGAVTATTSDALEYTEQGSYTIIWTYDDGHDNVSYQTQQVVVDDITAPVADVAELPELAGVCSVTVEAPTATDNCVGSVTGTTNDPMIYNEQGTFTINWTYNDGHGNVTNQTQQVVVADVTAPVADVAELPAITGECSVTAVAPTATDNCVGNVTGTTTDPLIYTEQGNYTIHWIYDDGHGNVTNQLQQVVVEDVIAPVADVESLPVITAECEANIVEMPTATDNCIGTVSGVTTDLLTYSEQGTFTIHWNYNDGHGNITSQEQTVIIEDVTIPTFDCPDDRVSCDGTVSSIEPVNVDDNCGTPVVSYVLTGATSGSGNGNANNEIFNEGVTQVTYTFDDGNSNVATCIVNVTYNKIDTLVTLSEYTLTAQGEGTYQWRDCTTQIPIAGATDKSYTAVQDGEYAVTITVGECSASSACHKVVGVGVQEETNNGISIYPNPVQNELNINMTSVNEDVVITIYSIKGQPIMRQIYHNSDVAQISTAKLPVGVYVVEATTQHSTSQVKLVKE